MLYEARGKENVLSVLNSEFLESKGDVSFYPQL